MKEEATTWKEGVERVNWLASEGEGKERDKGNAYNGVEGVNHVLCSRSRL